VIDELDQPLWLRNPAWRENRIRSDAKSGLRTAWLVAGLILLPAVFLLAILPGELDKGNTPALIALAFALVALFTTASALLKTLEWRRVGPLALVMDPFPGSLGGDVGGSVEIPARFDPRRRYLVTLACTHFRGDADRSGREDVIWEQQGLATATRSGRGTRLAFRFAPPDGLPESEPDSTDYRRWVVRLHAEARGANLDRTFEVPVFETGGERARWRQTGSHAELLDAAPPDPPDRLLRLRREGGIVELFYPPLRNPVLTLVVAVFAAICLGSGFFWLSVGSDLAWSSALAVVMSIVIYSVIGVILLIGGALAIATVYMLGNSLTVRADPEGITTVRRLFVIPIARRRLAANHLLAIDAKSTMRSGQGARSRKYEQIVARGTGGQEIVVGDGIDDPATADLVRRTIAEVCGLQDRTAG
jgi:hypothetical protein